MNMLSSLKRSSANAKPSNGDSSNEPSTLQTCCQSTPSCSPRPRVSAVSIAIPMRDPISACELEFGIPIHQVPTFQSSADVNNAASMPAAVPPSGGESTFDGMSSTSA